MSYQAKGLRLRLWSKGDIALIVMQTNTLATPYAPS